MARPAPCDAAPENIQFAGSSRRLHLRRRPLGLKPAPRNLLPLVTLEPLSDVISTWAKDHRVPIVESILELADALPSATVVGFEPEDVHPYLALLEALSPSIIVVTPHVFNEEGLRLVQGLVGRLTDPKDRKYYNSLIETAKSHLGTLQHLTAYAFASELARVVVFRADTDWAAPLFALLDDVERD